MNTLYTFYPPIKQEIKLISNQFSLEVQELSLFNYASIAVLLYDSDNRPTGRRKFKLEGDDYKAWTDDDTYIIKFLKSKLQDESNN